MYYLKLILYYCLLPFTFLVWWRKNVKYQLAIKLVFWNNYKHCLIYTQTQHETNNFQSSLCLNHNNLFGMGRNNSSPYQSSSVASGISGEPTFFASYRSILASVFDFYRYASQVQPSVLETINDIPPESFNIHSKAYNTYMGNYVTRIKSLNYFTGNSHNYALALDSFALDYKPFTATFIVLMVWFFVPFSYGAYILYTGKVHKLKIWRF